MFRSKTISAALATIGAVSALVLAGTPVAPTTPAEAATSVSGAIVKQGSRARHAGVRLWQWNGASWVVVARSAADSYGRYSFSGLADGYYYSVQGYKTYGNCIAGLQSWDGFSHVLLADGRARGANVHLAYQFNKSCYPSW